MTAFNPRHLARQVPATTWQAYLSSRSIAIPESFDWSAEEKAFSDALIALLEELEPDQQALLHAELRHVHALATQKGIDAILNASDNDVAIREDFGQLRNHAERAMWVLVNWPQTFMTAEALLQFDLGVGKRSWKRQAIKVTEPVSREAADIEGLQAALSEVLSKRKGPRRACHVDVCDRHLDGGVQISVYVEDDPNDLVEFVEEGMRRRTTRPATNLALVYFPASGIVDTVGRGGAKVHQPLVTLFARHLLKQEVKPEAVKQPMFYLNRLRHGLDLPEDSDIDLAAHGIDRIRLRRARLRSTRAPICDFWVGVPADQAEHCVLAASSAHLKDHDLFRGPFNVVEALISIYFAPAEMGKRGRVLNIDLKQSGISNLQDMAEEDAKLAERLLRAWRVSEPTEVELALVA
ncbi:MAG: hypothetical protein CMN57_12750 [Gammaproteobacteria bacterium]|nr:hypothetical protein [Gammaproteobacteria bacterium]